VQGEELNDNNIIKNKTGVEQETAYDCDGEDMQKIKFNDFSHATTTYNDNYEYGLINERILFEVSLY